jgi:hypothetical protein
MDSDMNQEQARAEVWKIFQLRHELMTEQDQEQDQARQALQTVFTPQPERKPA